MTSAPIYPYAQGDLLARPNTYFYTAFGGPPFLDAWRAARDEAVRWFESTATEVVAPRIDVEALFCAVSAGLEAGAAESMQAFDGLVQRFEVTKRVFGAYDARWRPLDARDYSALDRYVAFGELVAGVYAATMRLDALNALLKVNDILAAHRESVPPELRRRAAALIDAERTAVQGIAGTLAVAD